MATADLRDPLAGNENYEMVKFLNRGAFGFVILARAKNDAQLVALKFLERGPQTMSRYVEREIVNHIKLQHPHVITLHEVFLTQDHLVLVLEYAAGGDLFTKVQERRGLAEDEARWYFQQVIIAIDYCHRLGICSRDIKLENVLLDGSAKPLVKLCDFGFSKDASHHSAPGSKVGTPAYLAPEVILADQGATYDGSAADIWSCGVMLYVMVCGFYPFRRPADDTMRPTHRLDHLLKRILAVEYTFPDDSSPKALSTECKKLIGRMLVRDPSRRATVREVMAHPWYQVGLSPAVISFNDSLIRQSTEIAPEVIRGIADLVAEAATRAPSKAHPTPGTPSGLAGAPSAGGSSYLHDIDAMLRSSSSRK